MTTTTKKLLELISRIQVRPELEELIPGSKRDAYIVARRARLAMTQNMYDRGKINLKQALTILDGNLSPDKPETYYDDRNLLQRRMKHAQKHEQEIDF